MPNVCPLCLRVLDLSSSTHHLVPKLKGGNKGETVELHEICHRKIHSLFDEGEIANYYFTIEKLLDHDEIKKFVKWVSKKPPNFVDSSKEHSSKKYKHR